MKALKANADCVYTDYQRDDNSGICAVTVYHPFPTIINRYTFKYDPKNLPKLVSEGLGSEVSKSVSWW